MPIVQRDLRFYRPQQNGMANVCEYHVDHLGRIWPIYYATNKTEAEVITDMNARDLTEKLRTNEFRRGFALALATGDGRAADTIDDVGASNSDVTRQEMDRYIIKTAQKHPEPSDLVLFSSWVLGFTANQISNALWGNTSAPHVAKAQKVLDRASVIVNDYAVAEASLDASKNDAMDDEEFN